MVVALVLMLAAVLALGGMLYYQRLELCSVRADVAALDLRLKDVDHKLNRLHEYESIKAFEATVSVSLPLPGATEMQIKIVFF